MTQSKAELTGDKQILYLVQWFAEFSDFQRNDFLLDYLQPIYGKFLNEKILNNNNDDSSHNNDVDSNDGSNRDQLEDGLVENGLVSSGDNDGESATVNGLASLSMDNSRPPSIFQCRMKLFKEWYQQWTDNERVEFLLRLRNIDSAFLIEFYRLFFTKNEIANYDKFVELTTATTTTTTKKADLDDEIVTRLELNENLFAQFELTPAAAAVGNGVIDGSGSFNSLNSYNSLNLNSLNRPILAGSLATTTTNNNNHNAAQVTVTTISVDAVNSPSPIEPTTVPIDDQSTNNNDDVTLDCHTTTIDDDIDSSVKSAIVESDTAVLPANDTTVANDSQNSNQVGDDEPGNVANLTNDKQNGNSQVSVEVEKLANIEKMNENSETETTKVIDSIPKEEMVA